MGKGTRYIFVGNPGVGKSTLLNIITDFDKFNSGNSYGKGLTKFMQEYEHNGVMFYDSPGLADAEMRQQAGEEITKILKKGGDYKVFFVVTLEAGRVKPADRATMETILDCAPITDYGIILNKLTPGAYEDIHENTRTFGTDNAGAREAVLMQLMAGADTTSKSVHLHLIKELEVLQDTKHGEAAQKGELLKQQLVEFMNRVPTSSWQTTDVKEMADEKHQEEKEELLKRFIDQLHTDQEALKQTYKEEKEDMKKLLAAADARQAEME